MGEDDKSLAADVVWETLESIKDVNHYGVEYWGARDLMPLLGYDHWRNFEEVIKKAQGACEQSGEIVRNHFVGAVKLVRIGSQAGRRVDDYQLDRYDVTSSPKTATQEPQETRGAEASLIAALYLTLTPGCPGGSIRSACGTRR